MKLKLYGCLLFAVVGLIAQQQTQAPRVTGFFSDMRPTEAGDVVGTEIWIVYARGHYWAAVQEAEGEPNPPVVVPLDVSGLSTIKFTLTTHVVHGDGTPAPDLIRRYEGTVTEGGLLLSTPELSGSTPTLLKRHNSYWQ